MAEDDFKVDRDHLPKPWAKPLMFSLSRDNERIDAEIEQSAAIDYQSTAIRDLYSGLLQPERMESFALSVEDAVNRLVGELEDPPKSIKLGWVDLYPERS